MITKKGSYEQKRLRSRIIGKTCFVTPKVAYRDTNICLDIYELYDEETQCVGHRNSSLSYWQGFQV